MTNILGISRKSLSADSSSGHDPRTSKKRKVENKKSPYLRIFPTPGDIEAEPFPMVISANVNGYLVKHILVDYGSSVDVLYYHAFSKMGGRYEDLQPLSLTVVSFNAEEAKSCYMANIDNTPSPNSKILMNKPSSNSDIIDLRDEIPGTRPEPSEELVPVRIYGNQDPREKGLGSRLQESIKESLEPTGLGHALEKSHHKTQKKNQDPILINVEAVRSNRTATV
ncbi:uncharacterized protein G2W53_013875 [Senna tora]|uniref:Uncharacterized protein n=1 Tax=Senna tora TaxID=362788 RepID=A0A834U016_9FABA|nr:uncharacterized protein G2W53_013875 [Senna tora]